MASYYDPNLGAFVDEERGEIMPAQQANLSWDDVTGFVGDAAGVVGDIIGGGAGAAGGAIGTAVGGPIGGALGTVGGSLLGSLFGGDSSSGSSSSSSSSGSSSSAAGGSWQRYTIQPGDTLSQIAANFGTSVAELARVNEISDPNRIIAGQTIAVPATGGGSSSSSSSGGGFTTVSTGLNPPPGAGAYGGATPAAPQADPAYYPDQQTNGDCTSMGDNFFHCRADTRPNCGNGRSPEFIEWRDGGDTARFKCVQTQTPQGAPPVPSNGGTMQGGDMIDITPGLPAEAQSWLTKAVRWLKVVPFGAKVVRELARHFGFVRGKHDMPDAQCAMALAETLPEDVEEALWQFTCGFPAPINLSKRSSEVFLALKLAQSGLPPQMCCNRNSNSCG